MEKNYSKCQTELEDTRKLINQILREKGNNKKDYLRDIRCFICNNRGHIARNCRNNNGRYLNDRGITRYQRKKKMVRRDT